LSNGEKEKKGKENGADALQDGNGDHPVGGTKGGANTSESRRGGVEKPDRNGNTSLKKPAGEVLWVSRGRAGQLPAERSTNSLVFTRCRSCKASQAGIPPNDPEKDKGNTWPNRNQKE